MTPEQQQKAKRVLLVVLGLVAIGLAIPLVLGMFGEDAGDDNIVSDYQDQVSVVPHGAAPLDHPISSQPVAQPTTPDTLSPTPVLPQPAITAPKVHTGTLFKVVAFLVVAAILAAVLYLSYQLHTTTESVLDHLEDPEQLQREQELELQAKRQEEFRQERIKVIRGAALVAVFGAVLVLGVTGLVIWLFGSSMVSSILPFTDKVRDDKWGKTQLITMIGMTIIGLVGTIAAIILAPAFACFGAFGAIGIVFAFLAILHLIRNASYVDTLKHFKGKPWISLLFAAVSVLSFAGAILPILFGYAL